MDMDRLPERPHLQPQEHAVTSSGQAEGSANRKVLIADDDPGVVRALSLRCKKLGLEVETAENGLQAILKAQRHPPRLIILDINMPEVDGYRVCEWLLDQKRPPVDVIMLTGRDDLDALDRSDSFGAFYVQKNQYTWETIRSIMTEIFDIDEEALNAVGARSSIAVDELSQQKHNRILIVDDDTDLTRGLARRLGKSGAQTLTASNGIEAYRIAMRERPDAIIADYVMPEGGGHYLLWRLKSTEVTKNIPVIMISGQRLDPGLDSPFARDQMGREGPAAFLRKPLDYDALLKELSHHCAVQYSPS